MQVEEIISSSCSPEEMEDLRQLVLSRGWTSLARLFKQLEEAVNQEFLNFRSEQEAFERRGKLAGVKLGNQVIEQLYSGATNGSISKARNTSSEAGNSNSFRGISVPANPADEPVSGPSY